MHDQLISLVSPHVSEIVTYFERKVANDPFSSKLDMHKFSAKLSSGGLIEVPMLGFFPLF